MRNPPVHWYQGLFVRPQHFQAADRHWMEVCHTSESWDHPYNYGLRAFSYSKDALASGRFRVEELDARLHDGTLVRLENGQELEIDLKQAFDSQADADGDNTLMIYVGVPKLNLGGSNVGQNGGSDFTRYSRVQSQIADENGQANGQPIEFRKLNLRLLVGEETSGYEVIPVARVRSASDRDVQPVIDEQYIPPILSTQSWPFLRRHYLQGIRDVLSGNMDVLSEPVRQLSVGRHSLEPADSGRVSMLDRLNEAYCTLDVMAPAQGVHPFDAYSELARILGRLSIFGPQRRAIDVEPYDHDNLGFIFADIREKILGIIYATQFDEYLRANFDGHGSTMVAKLGPEWFDPGWEWYLGVERGGASESTMLELLEHSPEWYWVFASAEQVENYFHIRQSGLKREIVNTTIPDLPSRQYWTYYKVSQDDYESPAWAEIRRTQTIAMRVRNFDELTGARHLDVVLPDGNRARLRFALFAVRS
ncbi:type VI secretion system baseplate subunit TssK [Rhodopirellula sp. MGV]|uniref:type VI secretion system baseplate subunit TssK n=1 Tax=Rhodopirellula sp. MGV TaxID=2023130 RepID=UPI000B95E30B|nr:type VI secretion system baseplate subunit TssK [Rhodopirellula sp. MGV]OYP35802.1 type VI secretion system-associated protein [Rhodopirellula sp. MGV]PNY36385.1 type VI secretion system baseplate subunit TssK [Rhodopirellula baltica]